MTGEDHAKLSFRAGTFKRRIARVFGLQLVAVVIVCLLGVYGVAPPVAIFVVVVIVLLLGWMAAQREWAQVSALAAVISNWDTSPLSQELLSPENLARGTDTDIASLTEAFYGLATRIADFNQRERNFTRDASHELRSPLTVIKMSVDMLADEAGISEFGARSVRRVQRASREMEAVVDALLILARESDVGIHTERFVVNDALVHEIDAARDFLAGRPIELQFDQPARFALQGSRPVFSVLCWQLIRNACQQIEQGRVVVRVLPGAVTVSSHAEGSSSNGVTHSGRLAGGALTGFEMAIAQRISERYAWPLELETRRGNENVTRVHFPNPLPAAA